MWEKYVRSGEIRYYLNREHPLIAAMLEDGDDDRAKQIGAALGVIEDCFPVLSIGEDYSSNSGMMNQSALDKNTFLERLDAALPSLLMHAEGDMKVLRTVLASTEPWSSHVEIVTAHLNEKGWN